MQTHHIPEFDISKYPDVFTGNPKAALDFFTDMEAKRPLRLHVETFRPAKVKGDKDIAASYVYSLPTQRTELRAMLEQEAIARDPVNVFYCPQQASNARSVPHAADVTSLRAVAIDIDAQEINVDAWTSERERIKRIVHGAIHNALKPSYAVNTGNGAQLIFFINPVAATPENVKRYLETAQSLCRLYGGDPATAKSIHQLFRVPGTLNVPTLSKLTRGRVQQQGSVWHHSDLHYDLDNLHDWAVAGAPPAPPEDEQTDYRAADIDGLTFEMLVDAMDALDARINMVIKQRIADFDRFAGLHAEVIGTQPTEDRSGADFRYCIELMEAGLSMADTACALAHYGAVKARGRAATDWEVYIVRTVIRAKPKVSKPSEEWFDKGDETVNEAQGTAADFPFTLAADALKRNYNEEEHLIDDLLEKVSTSMIYGASNSGKSLFVLELCTCLASDEPFLGKPTHSKGIIVYLAMEGASGFPKRLRAIKDARPTRRFEDRLMYTAKPYSFFQKLTKGGDIDELYRHLDRVKKEVGPIDMVVIDMVGNISIGADENGNKDMNIVFSNVRALSEKYQTHVAALHHSGKDERRGSRGWSGMQGKIDTEMFVKQHGGKTGSVTVKKQRELWYDGDRPICHFQILSKPVAQRKDGVPITAAYISITALEPVEQREPTTPEQRKLLRQMQDFGNPVTIVELMEITGKARSTLQLMLKKMEDMGLVAKIAKHAGGPGHGATYIPTGNYTFDDDEEEQTDEPNDPYD